MCSYADEREQTSILMTFSTVSIGTTKMSLPFEMFTRLLQLVSGKSAIGDSLRLRSQEETTRLALNQHQLVTTNHNRKWHTELMVPSRKPAKVSRRIRHAASSGNVFEDLEVSSPEEGQANAQLTAKIGEIITSARLTQAAAARLLGVDQPKVCALLRGRLSGLSTDRLLKFVLALGRDVDIVIRAGPKGKRRGHLQAVSE